MCIFAAKKIKVMAISILNKIEYLVLLVSAFAAQSKVSEAEAYRYLSRYGALALCEKHYGPIANDRVGAQIARYKQGYITFDEFLRRIQYIKGITFQYAFCTQRAIDKLIKVK